MDGERTDWSIRRRRTKFERLFESAPLAHFVVSSNLRIVAVSDKYLRVTENQRDKLVGKYLDRDFSKNPNQPWIGDVSKLIKSLNRVRVSKKRHGFYVRENPWKRDIASENPPRIWHAINTPILDSSGNLNFIFHQLKRVRDPADSRLMRNFSRRLIDAQEADRGRISRELHDQMAQYLSAMMLRLESLKLQSNPQAIESEVEEIQSMIEQVGEEVHRLTRDLRPAPIEELGFRESLYSCVEDISSHSSLRIYFHSNLTKEQRFDPSIETVCYRFVQEALSNIVKHAHAVSASVVITHRDTELQIIVEDDGIGFDVSDYQHSAAHGSHFGLIGMKERMELVGGRLNIESAIGRGTSFFAEIPTEKPGVE